MSRRGTTESPRFTLHDICGRAGALTTPRPSEHDTNTFFVSILLRPHGYTKRLRKVSAVLATSRQPPSIVSACPRFGIITISVTPGFFCC
jgi:hypothetical protein